MQNALQNLTALRSSPASGILTTVLMLWLVWPILCALLGAMRGRAFSGFLNGLFWGPLGLLPVLLVARKYPCPTCGCKTLTQPQAVGPAALNGGVPAAPPQWMPAPPVIAPAVDMAPSAVQATPARLARPVGSPLTPARPVSGDPEAEHLHQWVNGEAAVKVQASRRAGLAPH